MKLGNNIYLLRQRKGLSQGDLAEALEVSRQSVSKWETGGATPDLDKLLALCDLFGITLDELVRGEIAETEAPAAPVAEEICNAPPVAETPAAAQPVSGDGSGMKVLLTVILVILGLWLLFSLFMSPSLWPGLLLLLVLGGFGYAIFQRDDRSTLKNQILRVLFIATAIFLPVLGIISALPDPPAYAKTGKESDIFLHETPLVSVIDFYLFNGNDSIYYTLQNDSVQPMGFKPSDSRVEVKKDGKWYNLVKQPSDKVYGYIVIQHGEVQHSGVNFEKVYGGKLSPGEYRLLVQVFSETQSSNIYWIAKEFTIQ